MLIVRTYVTPWYVCIHAQAWHTEYMLMHSNHVRMYLSTAVEFVQKMASVEEHHARQINNVVASFRKKTADHLKKDL